MAIQIPNPGTGNGATGDNEFVLWSKVKDNFSNTEHAASRLVGTGIDQIPTSSQTLKAANSVFDAIKSSAGDDCNTFTAGTRYLVRSGTTANAPISGTDYFIVDTIIAHPSNGSLTQVAYRYGSGTFMMMRNYYSSVWSEWITAATSSLTYTTTTASGANVVVDTTGKLMRSTSSERYKDIIADLELDDELYANAMQLAPIVYRSTADADNPAHHYYSFSAEALGAHDKAFTLWRDTETITDEDGNTKEQTLDEPVAEGINLNAIVAFLHATNVKQGKLIDELSARIGVLEDANK